MTTWPTFTLSQTGGRITVNPANVTSVTSDPRFTTTTIELTSVNSHDVDESAADVIAALTGKETEPELTYQKGDRCITWRTSDELPRVTHYDCDEYADGVVTNPVTGRVIR